MSLLEYITQYIRLYVLTVIHWFNYRLLKTYPLIADCARCEDCGRNVHDFIVPDNLWVSVYGDESGVLCYDCFCSRADKKFRMKWRMQLGAQWLTPC